MNLVEFASAGGSVRLLGQPLDERLTPRQLRFLFAVGAIQAGRRTIGRARPAGIPLGQLAPDVRARLRGDAHQAMRTHLQGLKLSRQAALGSMLTFPTTREAWVNATPAQRKGLLRWERQIQRGAAKFKALQLRLPGEHRPQFDPKKLLFRIGRG